MQESALSSPRLGVWDPLSEFNGGFSEGVWEDKLGMRIMHPTVNLYYCFTFTLYGVRTFYSLWIVVAFAVPPSDITQLPRKCADSG